MAVYCLVDSQRDACKVGFSRDRETLERRIKALQTASPFPLEVHGIRTDLDLSDESEIHFKLKRYRTGGGKEWFLFSDSKSVLDEYFFEQELTAEDMNHLANLVADRVMERLASQPTRQLANRQDLAKALSICVRKVDQLRASGKFIPATHNGNRPLFDVAECRTVLERGL